MSILVPIVEGDGEVDAVPLLLRRILAEKEHWGFKISRPKNAHGCSNLTKNGGLEKFVELAFREKDCSGVLVLMDADNDADCPIELAKLFTKRIINYGARKPVSVVLARREYEAWFLASLESIVGKDIGGRPGIINDATLDQDAEEIRGVKAWLTKRMPPGRIYKETADQAPMTDLIDFNLALRCRSFRRLVKAVDELVYAVNEGVTDVTPNFD